MREIKFRCFNSLFKEMVYAEPTKNNMEIFFAIVNKYENIMHYTGLKDHVNSKEIYEGDFVKGISRVGGSFTIKKVTFLNGCFMFGNWNAHEYFNKHQFIEVVGNIYENPELSKS